MSSRRQYRLRGNRPFQPSKLQFLKTTLGTSQGKRRTYLKMWILGILRPLSRQYLEANLAPIHSNGALRRNKIFWTLKTYPYLHDRRAAVAHMVGLQVSSLFLLLCLCLPPLFHRTRQVHTISPTKHTTSLFCPSANTSDHPHRLAQHFLYSSLPRPPLPCHPHFPINHLFYFLSYIFCHRSFSLYVTGVSFAKHY